MATNKSEIFFVFMAFVLFSSVKAGDDKVQMMCNQTKNPSLCVAVVHVDLREELKTNFTGLVKITTTAFLTNATNVVTYLKNWIPNEKNETNKEGLKECLSEYETDVTQEFINGLGLLNDAKYQDPKSNWRYEMLQRQIGGRHVSATFCVESPYVGDKDQLRNFTKMVSAIGMLASDLISLEHCNKITCQN
ncbi:hypothetical protein ACFE04_027137 [Oxalis oulophora]